MYKCCVLSICDYKKYLKVKHVIYEMFDIIIFN